MALRPPDFESGASASSATPACRVGRYTLHWSEGQALIAKLFVCNMRRAPFVKLCVLCCIFSERVCRKKRVCMFIIRILNLVLPLEG